MGFSSLNRLCELPIDTLKIDRAFVNRLTPNAQSHAVVSTIISLARAYGLQHDRGRRRDHGSNCRFSTPWAASSRRAFCTARR